MDIRLSAGLSLSSFSLCFVPPFFLEVRDNHSCQCYTEKASESTETSTFARRVFHDSSPKVRTDTRHKDVEYTDICLNDRSAHKSVSEEDDALPDLKPIEHLSAILKRNLKTVERRGDLLDSIPSHLHAVIESKGYPTKY